MIYQQLPSVIHSYLMNRQHTRITVTEELAECLSSPKLGKPETTILQKWEFRDDLGNNHHL